MTGSLCGHSDPGLNAVGVAQADALVHLLAEWNVRRLYASDLRRALQTAEPLARLWDIPVAVRRSLREMSFGDWEGRRWSDLRAEESNLKAMESSPELGAPGGETFACFRDRVLRALNEIVAECDGQVGAIVTHLGVIRVLLNEFNSTTDNWASKQPIAHCSVYRIHINGTSLVLKMR